MFPREHVLNSLNQQLPREVADPIAQVKTWIRLRAKCAGRVVQETLRGQVQSCGDAAATLALLAEQQVKSKEERQECIVISRSGDNASFADVMVGLVVRTKGGVYTTTHLLLLRLKYLGDTPLSVYDEWRELYKMGSTDVRALVADCVAMLEHHPWDDAMARIHVAKNLAEQCQNNCDFKTPAGREEVFAAICRDHGATSVRILSPYEAALQKYIHDGDASVRGLAAKFLSDQLQVVGKPQKCTIAIAFAKEEVGDDFVVCVYKIMVQDDTTIEQKFGDIVGEHAAYKAVAARDGVPFSFPQLREGDLQLDRFLVVYRYIESDEVPPQRNVGVDRSAHVLVIDSFNKLAAFYPTGWENETFKPETSVREVVS